ncbi:MAG: DUF885 family protein [Terriglobales bacterium]
MLLNRASLFFFFFFFTIVCAAQDGNWDRLLRLHQDFLALRDAGMKDAAHDFSPTAIRARALQLKELESRLGTISPSAWPVDQKVDWVLVRTELNDLDFRYRVIRPWSRDPSFYLDFFRTLPYADVPVPPEKLNNFRMQVRSVSGLVQQAKKNLAEAGGDLTDIATFHLEHYDGVGQGEPIRNVPPEGILGWYEDLLSRVQEQQPELTTDVRQALASVREYHDWLVVNRPKLNHPSAVGLTEYDWFIKHVRLMPYTAADLRVIGDVEASRARTFLKIEQAVNRNLPELELAKSGEEYAARVRQAEELIRSFLAANHLLTIPDYVGPQKTDAFWIQRPGGKRHFWEELQYRDPLVDHIHASLPGHRLDFLIHEHDTRPIRRDYEDGGRIEGWGFYCEEMMLQAGLLKDRPRVRELFYVAQLARAMRIPVELKIQSGEFSMQQAIQFMVKNVPFMDPNLARYDLEVYFRQPGYGMNYVAGKLQIEHLLAARAQQLGDKFDLGKFHDQFLAAGMIPVALTEWEITGTGINKESDLP